MSAEKIELVCFDLGGVLVRTCTVWSDLCRVARLEVRGASATEAADRLRRELSDAHQLGNMSTTEWIAAMVRGLDGLYTAEEITALHDAVLVEEFPGVHALIGELHAAGIATACLSNTNEPHWHKLVHHDGEKPLSGEPRYPAIHGLGAHHASHLMRLAKPSPAIYRAFEEAVGKRGSAILFFDDLAENVDGARRVGWRAERIDPARPTDEQMRRHLRAYGVI
jgi:putative hydrolase of the HAD superfamily